MPTDGWVAGGVDSVVRPHVTEALKSAPSAADVFDVFSETSSAQAVIEKAISRLSAQIQNFFMVPSDSFPLIFNGNFYGSIIADSLEFVKVPGKTPKKFTT